MDNITEHGPSVSYLSISATVSVPWTNWKCAGSTPFSFISCGMVRMTYDDEVKSLHARSPISGITGISHTGASSNGWYHASTNPLRSTTGYDRNVALRFVRWL